MWYNSKTATQLQNGKEVPTLALHKHIKISGSQPPNSALPLAPIKLPCYQAGQKLTTDAVTNSLDRAGEERFLAKAARLRTELAQTEPGQSLYQEIMGALGYRKNKLPFLELARRLPLHILASVTQSKIPDEEKLAHLQTLLLGTAGLSPSPQYDKHRKNRLNDKWPDRLEKQWDSFHHIEIMPPEAWHLFKVRPSNSPGRRLVAMSYLLLRYRRKGLLEELVGLVQETPLKDGHHQLEKGLLVTANGQQLTHSDLASAGQRNSTTLLGSGRAADIIVNVLLPFTFAWSRFTAQPELERKASNLYRNYPRLSVNSVERHMTSQLGLSNNLVDSARRQQGLIQIYNNLCTQGKCNHCRLSQFKTRNHIQI